ncbi:transcriptional regulator [Actinomadura sp. NBRC 104425]|uniref:helix-turn-helix domain-containing protein n=1 Tax=Actinomadura sp. NBRC 104425 TaxID=3032204 RepID=UPI0024A1685C|nr:helix-turn-helix transcriptional regulator [Actinomadura sp. NBRC 104425]GLZ12589.1 transcriptional regulator [Actinomadura sp. NBRC 104425]
MARHLPDVHLRRRRLGHALRALRRQAALDLDEAAGCIGWTGRRLGSLEAGLATVRRADVKELLALYGVAGGDAGHVLALLDGTAGWWAPYSDLVHDDFETLLVLEEGADRMSTHQAGLIPGMLQTRDYSWELITTMSDQPLDRIERLVELRQARRRALDRHPRPRMTVLIDEAALRRPVGGPEVMRGQFERLVAAAREPEMTLLVRPLDAGPHRAATFTFHLFEFAGDRPIVQSELFDRVEVVHADRQIALYREAFAKALEGALSPDESVSFIAELADRC